MATSTNAFRTLCRRLGTRGFCLLYAMGAACSSGGTAWLESTATETDSSALSGGSPITPQGASGKCLDVAWGNTANATPVQITTCNGNVAQSWTYTQGRLQVLGHKCLDVVDGKAANGTKLQIWECSNTNANQQWTRSGNTFVWKNTYCLDLPGGNSTDGTRPQIYGCGPSNNVNQNWSFGSAGSGKFSKLVWADEFNGSTLNENLWNIEVNCDGGYNNELECYTRAAANVSVDGQGHLVLKAFKQNGLANGKTFTSGRINTQNKKSVGYGRIEARIKIPSGRGVWPAFWTMPTANTYGIWPTSGELDIMEVLGQLPGTLYGTAHFGSTSAHTQKQGSVQGADLSTDYHVYALERDANQVRWYLDDKLYYTLHDTDAAFWPAGYTPPDGSRWPFTQGFFIIFNLAMGGDWPGTPDPAINAASMLVDYVRVYQ
jgi:beta-glucanase (GH16 family)